MPCTVRPIPVRSVLTPEQYEKLQEIRQKEVGQAIQKERNQ
jgi:Spy/CpxP family protein refolding chaperone